MIRTALFWMHLSAGLTAGVVILVMSTTGVVLTYERQMTEWADGYRVARPAPQTPRLGVEALAARVREARGVWPNSITLRADETAPASFAMGREGAVFVNPWTGELLGEGSKRARAFFRAVTDWHRWLAASGEARPTGKAVTGAANLLFLFIVLSGLVLWWPKGLRPRHFRPVTLFQGGLSGKARDFNWHNVFGFWAALPLAAVVASAVVISYPWASDLVHRLAGSEPPRRGGGPGGPGAAPAGPGAAPAGRERSAGGEGGPRAEISLAGLDRAWAVAEGRVAGWQSLTLRVPTTPDAPFAFTIDTDLSARRPSTRSQLVVDRRTGDVVREEPYASQSAGRKATGWLRFIHTGEAFGLAGQTIAGLASLAGVMLTWTGASLALRRFAAWRGRRARAAAAAATDVAA
jgi:uncharacterized iron-regulated membrane protein